LEDVLRNGHHRRWEQAIPLLLAGMSKDKVATELGVRPGTIEAWEQDPAFCRRRQEILEGTFAHAAQVLRNSSFEAVEKLLGRVKEGDINAAVHVLKAVGLYAEKTAVRMNHDHGGEIIVRWDDGDGAREADSDAQYGRGPVLPGRVTDTDRPVPPVYSAAEVS
jgi:transposase